MYCDITSTISSPTTITPRVADDCLSFTFTADAGLYQLSVNMDARDFDWEQLYEILNKYHNVDQRTGPWDFSINYGAIPLVPAYWVSVNGKRLGLWFFERVSLEDLERERFRGRVAFYAEGETTVELEPFDTKGPTLPSVEDERARDITGEAIDGPADTPRYDRSGLKWISARLEVDPEDRLEALPEGIFDGRHSPAAKWGDASFWRPFREGFDTTYALYEEPIRRAAQWVMEAPLAAENMLLLVGAWRLLDTPSALQRALETVDDLVAKPAYGNPNPAGYSHNGDMGGMNALRALAFAYHALGEELGEERRAGLLDKLRRHGEIFFDLALLNRDYWGGSIVQDHGWKSLFGFGVVAFTMLGIIPEAERWVRMCLPRLRRSVAAMPLDGVVPGSSHYSIYLYLDEVTQYREALLAQAGEDLYDQPQFLPIIDYLVKAVDFEHGALLTSGTRFVGGAQFLNQMASKHRDDRAAWLQERLQQTRQDVFYHGTQIFGYYLSAVQGLLSHDPTVAAVAPEERRASLEYFADSGLAHYRDNASKLALSVQCAPYSGYNSYYASVCSCDRLGIVPGEGHFTIYLDGVPLLCTPDGGYSLKSSLRSCLLIDGRGQYGDIGYPMSIPSKLHRGEQVQYVNWDETTQTGLVRLFLTPAYPEQIGLAHYTRDFLLAPGQVTVRDTVVLDEPRQLSWLFQGKSDRGLQVDGLKATFGQGSRLEIEPRSNGLALQAAIRDTEIVWSYASSNNFEPFEHALYDTVEPVRSVVVDFVISPKV
ncbi:MAG: hypothetical protein ACYC63_20785 [Armatimonadota bacterium]